MIKLFVTDLDGCITHPFETPDWESISKIRKYNQQSRENDLIPGLTICSGRPFPYVEAVGQWLDVEVPMVFESGGGMYNIKTNEVVWNPHFDDEARKAVVELKQWIEKVLIKNYKGTYPEFAKYTDAGIVNPDPSKIKQMHDEILNYVPDRYPMFEIHATDISVNVILKKANKGVGIQNLCDELGLKLNEVAYIGDSSGDIPALEIVGRSFAPKNAKSYVKKVADHVIGEATMGVLETYEMLIEGNS